MKGRGKYSVPKSSRDFVDKSNMPGPGSYEYKTKSIEGQKMSFGKEYKLKEEKNGNPGPGQYNLKPFFADVPHYLLKPN